METNTKTNRKFSTLFIRASQELAEEVSWRGESKPGVIRCILITWFSLMRRRAARLARVFSQNEFQAMMAATAGIQFEPEKLGQEVIESVATSPDVAAKWEVDLDDLLRRMEKLDDVDRLALVDSIKRSRHAPPTPEGPSITW